MSENELNYNSQVWSQ